MAKLSERLKATDKLTIHTVEEEGGTFVARHIPESLMEEIAAVCALVEAFQAAEQAYREAATADNKDEKFVALKAVWAAKARLLEVNLG